MRSHKAVVGPTVLACGLACLVVLSACSPPSEAPDQTSEGRVQEGPSAPPETVDSRATNFWTLPEGRVEVSLHRVDDEHMVALMSLTNEGDWELPVNMESLSTLLADEYLGDEEKIFTGIAWLSPDGRELYKPYLGEDNTCLCSDTDDALYLKPADSGDHTWEGHAVLQAPPADVEELTVVTRVAPPFVDVPVQQGVPEGLDYTAPENAPDADPQVAELESVTDSDEETVIENSDSTDINLSTDVLFEVDESDLTGEADALLDSIATRIEDSGVTEITVEGHADNTGSDEINEPLSQERADSVRDRLEELVDTDIEYTTEGHGSQKPIADNDNEEGRALNRRVTISIPTDMITENNTPGEGAPDQGEGTPASEVSFTGPADDPDLPELEVEVDLTDLRAVTDSTALLTYRVSNPNEESLMVGLDMGKGWMAFRSHSAHDVNLENSNGTAYPLRVEAPDGDGKRPTCLCTSTSGSDLSALIIDPGDTHEYYSFLPITPGSTVTDISFGDIETVEDIAIQQ